jgi:hypothetical protein
MAKLLIAAYQFPQFLYLHLLGLLLAVLTDFVTFGLVVLGVLIAIATTPAIGAAAAFGLYLVMRQTTIVATAVLSSR